MQRGWLEGFQKLGPEVLRQHFPQTWGGRGREETEKAAFVVVAAAAAVGAGVGAGQEKLIPEDLAKRDGGFFLPLDINTTPVEAVRFARAVLEEWAGREGSLGAADGDGGKKEGWRSRID